VGTATSASRTATSSPPRWPPNRSPRLNAGRGSGTPRTRVSR